MTSIRILRLPNKYQKGAGWGNVFSRITSFLRPFLSSAIRAGKPMAQNAIKQIANESIKTGANIISDITEGQNIKESIKQRGKQGLKSGKNILVDEVKKGINRQMGGKSHSSKATTTKTKGVHKKQKKKKKLKFKPQKGFFY